MWRRIKRNVRNIVQKVVNFSIKNRKREFDEFGDEDSDTYSRIAFKHSANDIVLQVDGNWVSKSLIDAIISDRCEQKLLLSPKSMSYIKHFKSLTTFCIQQNLPPNECLVVGML